MFEIKFDYPEDFIRTGHGNSVIEDKDGGYIIACGGANTYLFIIKTDQQGKEQWVKKFYPKQDNRDFFFPIEGHSCNGQDIQQTDDGGYIILGEFIRSESGKLVWLIKIDADGNKLWEEEYGGDQNYTPISFDILNDCGFIITGFSKMPSDWAKPNASLFLLKIDRNGKKIWEQNYQANSGWSIIQTKDLGYIIAGRRYLLKTDANGNKKWTNHYASGYSVDQLSDGGYIIISDLLVKTDNNGKELWSKRIFNNSKSLVSKVKQTKDDGYIILGDNMLIKADENGEKIWEENYFEKNKSIFYSIKETKDSGFILTGYKDSKVLLMKTDSEGNTADYND